MVLIYLFMAIRRTRPLQSRMMNHTMAVPRGVRILARDRGCRFGDSRSSLASQLSRIKVFHQSQESILVGFWHLEKFQTKPIALRPSHLGDFHPNRVMRHQHMQPDVFIGNETP
jgi:hypothetical protein